MLKGGIWSLKKVTNTVHKGHILEWILPNIFNNKFVLTRSHLGQYVDEMKMEGIVSTDSQVILQKELED